MNTTAMLPPKMIPSTSVGLFNSNGESNNSTTTTATASKAGRTIPIDTMGSVGSSEPQSVKYDDVENPGNLNEDSMMMLSQSVDSINTLGTNGGVDETDHQVRTIFVSGLPLDAKPRELYLLFCGFKGYLSSTLKPAGKNGKPTAPVGFVTFKSREQAEDVMLKLQGIKFDPEGMQCMRLEFARTNTKVTKPKFPYTTSGTTVVGCNNTNNASSSSNTNHSLGVVGVGGTSGGLGHLPAHSPPIAVGPGVLPIGVANPGAGHAALVAPGFMANYQPASILSQLMAAAASTGPNGAYDTSQTTAAMYAAAQMDPMLAAAAAAAAGLQWNPSVISGTPPTAYDNAAYLASSNGLLQASQLRAMMPSGLAPTGLTTSVAGGPNFQMVQTAIAQASAAAAQLSAAAAAAAHSTSSTTVTSPSQFAGNPTGPGGGTRSPSTQQAVARAASAGSVATSASARTQSPTQHHLVTASPAHHQGFAAVHIGQTASPATLSAQHQQQQQSMAAAYHQTAASMGLTVPPHAHNQHHHQQQHHQHSQQQQQHQQQQMAAAFGLLGGYSSLVKELTGSEGGQVISPQTMASTTLPGGYVNF